MPTSTSSDDITTAFVRVYGTIVDQIDFPSDELPALRIAPTGPPQRRRGPLFAVAAAIVVTLAVGGAALLRGPAPLATAPPVDRIALLRPPPELPGPVELVSAAVDTSLAADAAPMQVWLWEAGDDPSRVVVLVETDPGADLEAFGLLGEDDPGPPPDGQVAEIVTDGGLTGRSWVEGASWRIVVGSEASLVAEVAEQARGAAPSDVGIEGFGLAGGGPQSLSSEVPVELVDTQYRTADGLVHISLVRGVPFASSLIRLQMPDAELTSVAGSPAVVGILGPDGDVPGFALVSWQVDDHSSAFVISDVLTPQAATAVAAATEALSMEEWNELVADVPPPSPFSAAFLSHSDQVVIASGGSWEVRAQVVSVPGTPDVLGVCGWMTADGTGELYDMGCQGEGESFGQAPPGQVRTGDGLVVTGGAPAEVVEIRIEAASPEDVITTRNHVIDPAVPHGWWAVALPEGPTYTQVTFWDADGNQLPGDGRLKADQILETD